MALDYGLFAVLLTAVVVVTLTGMGSNFGAFYEHVKTKLRVPPSNSTPAPPVATPAVNNAAGMTAIRSVMIIQTAPYSDSP